MTQLAGRFRECRETQGLTRQQVVEKTPYRNVAKGVQRLWALEEGYWTPDEKVVAWFAEALAIPLDDVRQARNADWDRVEEEYQNRLPADTCASCDRKPGEVGGRRLLTTISRALFILGIQTNWAGNWKEMRAIRLDDPYSQLYVILAGFKASDDFLDRARSQAQAGQVPWFCMWCAGQVCKLCGSLSREVPGSTFLDDNGRTTYYALLPIGEPGCSNPKCKGYR